MFLNYDRVIKHKGDSITLSVSLMKKAADIFGVSIEEIQKLTEQWWPVSQITKSNSSKDDIQNVRSSKGLQERLKLITKGK
ncbi:hypothetical protein ACWKSU_07430 [Enterobacter cloacae]